MMPTNKRRRICFGALLIAVACTPWAVAGEGLMLEVAAGDFDREATIVSVELPPPLAACSALTLTRMDNGQAVPVQVDRRGEKNLAVWILRDKLAAGQARRYRLAPAGEQASDADGVTVQDDGKRLIVQVGGKPVLAYNQAVVPATDPAVAIHARNGYLHPVYNPAGQVVTDDLGTTHAYHHGIWFAWRHTTFKGHATDGWYETTKTGRLEHTKTGDFGGGPVFGHFAVSMHQLDLTSPEAPLPILDETWHVVVYRLSDCFVFDLKSTQTCATDQPVTIDECAYGGMSIRGHRDWLNVAKSQSEFLTDEGKGRGNGNHTRPRWCDMHGLVEGKMTGITALDHPGNFRFPQPVRLCPTIPYFCFAPEVLGPFTIEPGKPYESRYRFCVHNGEVDRKLAERLWQDYTRPPVAAFVPDAADAAAAKKRPPAAPFWVVRPWQIEQKVNEWAKKYPQLVTVEAQKTLGGNTAYAITVTNSQIDDGQKRKLLVTQPHAHEPAAIAGMVDFLSQVLDGVHVDGQPSKLDRQVILDRMVLTCIPCGNPDGVARAPEDWWDGSKYSNADFLKVFFGREADGRMSPRVGRFNAGERAAERIGISYERINEEAYVEPNRDRESTFFKLILRMNKKYAYDAYLDLHQTEFARSKYNAMIILPCLQPELPEPIRRANQQMGEAIVRAWQAAGAAPIPSVKPLGYGEDQLRYFRACWGDLYRAMPVLNIEVQNNNVRTPPRTQMELMEVAIDTTIEYLLGAGR